MKRAFVVAAICLALAGCGEDERIPDGFERVTGSERLGWEQRASSASELARFGYKIYIDQDAGVQVQGVSCADTAGAAGFACTGQLPSLSAGAHTLRLSTFVDVGGERLESALSAALNVFKVAQSLMTSRRTITMPPGGPDDLDPTAKSPSSQSSPASPPDPAFTFTSAAGLSIDAHVIAEPLEEPTALAFAAGGTLFVAERAGRVRILRGGRLRPVPALVLDDVAADGGLLTLAVDPQFERSGFVYLVYAGDRGLRLARYRVVADTLGERAILLDGLPFAPGRPAAWLRFGPDAKLYLGLDDGGDPRNAGDLGSFSGKVLRLNPDGTTPADQDGLSPVYALDFNAPREGTWSASGRVLWVADNPGAETGQLHVVAEDAAADGRRSGKTVTRYALPEGTAAAGLTFYHEELLPAFRDSLLVALNGPAGSPALLMLSIDASNPTRVTNTEHLLDSLPEPIRAIAVSPDGVVYLGTPSRLLALAPARER